MTRFLRPVGLLLAFVLAAAAAAAQSPLTVRPPAEVLRSADVLIVDIRRPEEWRQTGVLPEAVLRTYDGSDPQAFARELRAALAPGQPVALICRSGNRTAHAARDLAPLLDAQVIDIAGGMLRLIDEGYRPLPPRRAQGCATC